jgi:hypothetical protein
MHDPSSLRSKAEASLRLAELAKTPRARELFLELADEYKRRVRGELAAEQQVEAAPSLVPVAPLVADVPIVTDAPATAGVLLVADVPPTAAAPVAPEAPTAAEAPPLVPTVPSSESNQFIAGLKALREESSRE